MSKKIVTVLGIRPDLIRMSQVIRRLDKSSFEHILIHSGQHFDPMLSDIFFQDLDIRKPDFNLGVGRPGIEHFQIVSEVTSALLQTLRSSQIDPACILFLGDSNTVLCAPHLRKEGYTIGHIEAGMRSYDQRMLEETNRVVCDHCSTYHFVYHQDYADNLVNEDFPSSNIHVVGNTIVEVCQPLAQPLLNTKKAGNYILLDIHRPENFRDPLRLHLIHDFALRCRHQFGVPVKLLKFGRAFHAMKEAGVRIEDFELLDLMSYRQFLECQYHSLLMISDSGTAQEEPALLNTPVIVPREFTERPQSEHNGCSYRVRIGSRASKNAAIKWVEKYIQGCVSHNSNWLGAGYTAETIVEILGYTL